MERREILKKLPLAFAGLAFAPNVTSVWSQSSQQTFSNTVEEHDLAAIAETILPETDTPGAIAAGVPAFILVAVDKLLSPQEKEAFKANLQTFSENCLTKYNTEFANLDTTRQIEHLSELMNKEDRFIGDMKAMTLFGYFTSEVGMTSALHYDPVPGKFDPCVKVDENTRADAQYF